MHVKLLEWYFFNVANIPIPSFWTDALKKARKKEGENREADAPRKKIVKVDYKSLDAGEKGDTDVISLK